MNWEVKVSSRAEKNPKRLAKGMREKIKKSLFELSRTENPLEDSAVRALTGRMKGFYRLRVGEYRVIFGILGNDKVIAVVNIAPRGDVY
jgi:mRNA interferase RelE/StbE